MGSRWRLTFEFFHNGRGKHPMAGERMRLDQIVDALLNNGGTKEERKKLLRELVRRGNDLPEEIVDSALQKLMERLAD